MDINILTINPETRIASFRFNRVPRKTRGIEGLLQLAAKTILQTPGQDIWSPEYGGGLLSYTANGVNSKMKARVRSDITYIIRQSERQILDEQSDMILNSDERLQSLKLLDIEWLSDNVSIIIRVLVTSVSGENADMRLPNQLMEDDTEETETNTVTPVNIYTNKNEKVG